ncbi:MAG: peptidoglycan-binding protein [Candidatus Entotheonella gemina]|uniref:Peptidoglycan-binding protein n=1 Tax=Candidatus Entotheonella gemina TaxID=1429439 RepID=W4M3A3_9BACT|nr:MAG: peptidoglycan-binding protein [Candidatus Entotheonella gemina]
MSTIKGSVGKGGQNNPLDVEIIQKLLNRNIGLLSPLRLLKVDRRVGPQTINAIEVFQRRVVGMQRPDGRVDPNGKTIRKLAAQAQPALEQWTGDSRKWSEEKKLQSLNAQFRPKVSTLLNALRLRGFQPKLFYGWRSVAVQQELYKKGRSKVRFSFHNAQAPSGVPNAYAADIIDKRYAWSESEETQKFWKALGEEAKKAGLYWGGDWVNFKDWAHVQFYPNSALQRVKQESGL